MLNQADTETQQVNLKPYSFFHIPQNIPEQFLQLNVVHYSTIVPMKVYLWSEGLGG